MEDTLESLKAEFAVEGNYEALDEILHRLERIKATSSELDEVTLLRGAILQRRCEWVEAYQLLCASISLPDFNISVAYEAMLNAIDAGAYSTARLLASMLNCRITELTPRFLRGQWRACSLLGMHTTALAAFERSIELGSEYTSEGIGARITTAIHNEANCKFV